MSTRPSRLRGSVTAVLALVLAHGTAIGQADKDQQKCINALNKGGAKVAATQGKENTGCLRDAGKGKLPSGQTADECLLADAEEKVANAKTKTQQDFAAK